MKIKGLIVDLDSTLFRTELVKDKIFDFIRSCGFVEEEIKKIYNESRSIGNVNVFTLRHLEEVTRRHIESGERGQSFNEERWRGIVSGEEFKNGELLIDGAQEFIEYAEKNNIPFFIVTLGVHEWQLDKINMSGLGEMLEKRGMPVSQIVRHTVNEIDGKEELIKNIISELGVVSCEGLVFVNDKPDETERILEKFPELRAVIRVESSDVRYSEEDYERLRQNERVLSVSTRLPGQKELGENGEILQNQIS